MNHTKELVWGPRSRYIYGQALQTSGSTSLCPGLLTIARLCLDAIDELPCPTTFQMELKLRQFRFWPCQFKAYYCSMGLEWLFKQAVSEGEVSICVRRDLKKVVALNTQPYLKTHLM